MAFLSEWSHFRIPCTDSKYTTLITDEGLVSGPKRKVERAFGVFLGVFENPPPHLEMKIP